MREKKPPPPHERTRVYRLVCSFLPPSFDREFITDTIILQSWEKGIDHPSSTFIHHKCISAWRRRQREERRNEEFISVAIPVREDDPKEGKEIEDKSTIERAVSILTPLERKLIWMRFYDNQTLEEISLNAEMKREEVQRALKAALYKMRVELTTSEL